MQIISATDNENDRWKKKSIKNKDRKELRIDTRYSESGRAKWFFMSLTMTTSFANAARTTASTSKFIH